MPAKRNLISCLLRLHDSGNGIYFTSSSGEDLFLSYDNLLKSARGILYQLYNRGLRKGDELIFQFNSNVNFILAFWACQLGGIVPVPVTASKTDEVKQKLLSIWKTLRHPWLISDWSENTNAINNIDFPGFDKIKSNVDQRYISFNTINQNPDKLAEIEDIDENNTAFIQFSSGSTGQPKGVILTHRNLITNLQAIQTALKPVKNSDFACCWTPLTHDLGIIGGHIMPIFAQISQNLIPTNYYLKNPSIWLQNISRYKATFSAAPNFGFYYSAKHVHSQKLQGIDLSSIKYILNGAEPVSYTVCEKFITTFHTYGLKKNTVLPVYGMAEACLAVTIPELHHPLKAIYIKRSTLKQGDEVEITNNENSACFVSVGKPVTGCSVKISHENECREEDKRIGEILIKGENVTRKYYGRLKKVTDKNGWFNTGDLGFVLNNNLVITGRKKDIIFSKGQNYYPNDLERIAEQLDEIETSKIVFAGYHCLDTGIEEVLGFILYKGSINAFVSLADKVKLHVSEKTGIGIKHIIAVKKIPKTTSGKVQRYVLIEKYRDGTFDDILLQIEKIKGNSQHRQVIGGKNDIENQLIDIWEEILETKPIGITDNFFELGGDSVKAIRIGTRLQELQYTCEPALIFEKKTIENISECIIQSSERKTVNKEPVNKELQKEQQEYSVTHFSNDDLEDVFSKK